MPFPKPTQIKVGPLQAATPTLFDAACLKTQLQNIGLSCAQINQTNLNQYITEVLSQVPAGATQSFAIKAPSGDIGPVSDLAAAPGMVALAAAVPSQVTAATGNWTIDPTGDGFGPQLEVIQYPDHFNWLYGNRNTNGFTGVIDNPPTYSGNFPNAQAIQNLFINVCLTASATLVKGLDQATMTAMLSNVIQPLTDNNISNYNVSDSRTIYLVDNYNQTTQVADGLGVLYISWTLNISDYKRKTKDGGDTHPTSLTIKSGSVLYSDPSTLCRDYNAVIKQFNIDPKTAPACNY